MPPPRSTRPRRTSRGALLALGSLGLVAALGGLARLRPPATAAPRGLVVHAASFVNRVDRAATTTRVDGSVALRTDRGVDVRVTRALVVQQSASLVDCLGVGGDVWASGASALLGGLSFERDALAGHGQGLDPSAVTKPKLIDLLADGDAPFGTSRFPELRYCRVHFVFLGSTRAPDADGTATAALGRASIAVTGSFRLADAGPAGATAPEWTAFDWSTTQADALLLDLPGLIDGSLEGAEATVTVERRLARAFDGVDFARNDPEGNRANAARVLRNANHDARVRVRALP